MFYNAFINTRDAIWRLLLCLCIVSAIISANNVASAAEGDSGTISNASAQEKANVFGDQLCNIVLGLQGNIARAIATVAVFALGVGLFMGKLQWGSAAVTAIGIVTIFSAGKVVEWLGGGDVEGCQGVN